MFFCSYRIWCSSLGEPFSALSKIKTTLFFLRFCRNSCIDLVGSEKNTEVNRETRKEYMPQRALCLEGVQYCLNNDVIPELQNCSRSFVKHIEGRHLEIS